MKAVVLVYSCAQDARRGCHQAINETWARGNRAAQPSILRSLFIIGKNDGCNITTSNEVLVDAPDDYAGIAFKVREGARWARKHGYDYVLNCDVDTYVAPWNMLKLLRDNLAHYRGWRCSEGHAAGGHGYLLDWLACEVVANGESPGGYGDLWVGRTLQAAGIECEHDARFAPDEAAWNDDSVAVHLGRGTGNYDPAWMRDFHQRTLPVESRARRRRRT